MVGFVDNLSPGTTRGFLRDGGTCTIFDFPTGPGTQLKTYAYGINNAGNIVGQLILEPYSLTDGFARIGSTYGRVTFPLSYRSAAAGLNNAGRIVGSYLDLFSGRNRGFLLQSTQ